MEDKDAEVVVELWFENVMLENLNIYIYDNLGAVIL